MKSENAQKGITGVFLPGWLSWVLTFCMAFSSLGAALGSTYGIWTVSTAIESNSVSAGVWDSDPEPEEPDPNAPQPTATVVLNEIYPNRNAASSSPLNTEWIELYNGTNEAVDVEKWQVRVDNSTHKIIAVCSNASNKMAPMNGASTIIPAGGLLIIEFCKNGAFNKLPNDGATVLLSPHGVGNKVDEYHYPATIVGKSHARIPDGGSWVDPLPTPGEPNKATVADLEAEGWTLEEIEAVKEAVIDFDEMLAGLTASTSTDKSEGAISTTTDANISGRSGGSGSGVQDPNDQNNEGQDDNVDNAANYDEQDNNGNKENSDGDENSDEEKDLSVPENTAEGEDEEDSEHPNDPTVITDPEPSTKPESSPEPEDPPVEPEPEPAKTKESAPAAPSEPAPEPPPAPSAPDSSSESAS